MKKLVFSFLAVMSIVGCSAGSSHGQGGGAGTAEAIASPEAYFVKPVGVCEKDRGYTYYQSEIVDHPTERGAKLKYNIHIYPEHNYQVSIDIYSRANLGSEQLEFAGYREEVMVGEWTWDGVNFQLGGFGEVRMKTESSDSTQFTMNLNGEGPSLVKGKRLHLSSEVSTSTRAVPESMQCQQQSIKTVQNAMSVLRKRLTRISICRSSEDDGAVFEKFWYHDGNIAVGKATFTISKLDLLPNGLKKEFPIPRGVEATSLVISPHSYGFADLYYANWAWERVGDLSRGTILYSNEFVFLGIEGHAHFLIPNSSGGGAVVMETNERLSIDE